MAKTSQRLRGNANGRKPAHWQRPFYCDGCRKEHGPNVTRTQTLDGKLLCDRAYEIHKGKEVSVRATPLQSDLVSPLLRAQQGSEAAQPRFAFDADDLPLFEKKAQEAR